MLVLHRSAELFPSFATNEANLGSMGHGLTAIEDSRLLQIEEDSLAVVRSSES